MRRAVLFVNLTGNIPSKGLPFLVGLLSISTFQTYFPRYAALLFNFYHLPSTFHLFFLVRSTVSNFHLLEFATL